MHKREEKWLENSIDWEYPFSSPASMCACDAEKRERAFKEKLRKIFPLHSVLSVVRNKKHLKFFPQRKKVIDRRKS